MNDTRHRDQAIERLLRRSAPSKDAGPGECPDAGLLAAWVDGNLTAAESAAVEAHAAACARCQAVTATVVRTTSALPAHVSLWQRWRPGWLLPLAAGAAAVMLWIAWPTGDLQISEVAQDLGDANRQAALSAPRRDEEIAAEVPSAPRSVEDRIGAAAPEPEAPLAEADMTARAERAQEAPPAPTAPPAAPGLREQAAAPVVVASANPDIQWRVDEPGVVRYTRDGGSTWEESATGVAVALTAGTSPFPPVCWLVGRAGTILLTTDGREWQRVPFPETVDLVEVQALDAEIAAVTTSDGRTFRTTDGGVSWN